MNKERLEAFTDAIVAIIVTVLVLELPKPEGYTLTNLLANWHAYIVYVSVFALIIGVWYNHHNLFKHAKVIDRTIFWANAFWILIQSFVPYVTSWIGEFPDHALPLISLCGICILWTLSYHLMYYLLKRLNPDMPAYDWKRTFGFILSYLMIAGLAMFSPLVGLLAVVVLSLAGFVFSRQDLV